MLTDEYICTSLIRPWGRDGEDVECFGIDLDALYVNTGFRTAILDVLRGPARTGTANVCRFAEPEEFQPKKKKRWFGWGKKEAKTAAARRRDSTASSLSGAPTRDEMIEAATRAQAARMQGPTASTDSAGQPRLPGNWLWQLVPELLPRDGKADATDVLDAAIPPRHNRRRNPDCHPPDSELVPVGYDGDMDVPSSGPPEQPRAAAAAGAAAGAGAASPASKSAAVGKSVSAALSKAVGLIDAPGRVAGGAGKGAAMEMAQRRSDDINEKRRLVGLPELPDPMSREETMKRVKSRRGALNMVLRFKFAIPREELESILFSYEGPYGSVADMDEVR
jgi:hypothetical protein